jgi:tryptophan-rich hypothetical protein
MESHRIDQRALLQSKWTAVEPQNREKHFVAVELIRGENGEVEAVLLEAILTQRRQQISIDQLRDAHRWSTGWQ